MSEPQVGKPSPFSITPISVRTLICLRVLGWAVALSGAITGIIMLANAPEVQSPVKLFYLLISLMLIIGSIAAGVVLNVMAGIGSVVLDLWMAQQNG
jgi:hypothetical protein